MQFYFNRYLIQEFVVKKLKGIFTFSCNKNFSNMKYFNSPTIIKRRSNHKIPASNSPANRRDTIVQQYHPFSRSPDPSL